MRRFSSWAVIVLAFAGAAGCERDLPFVVPPDQPVAGYHLEGYVTDRLGIPVKGLPIALWYDFDYLDSNPPPRGPFVVTDSLAENLVQVFDYGSNLRRVLFKGRRPVGPLDVEWDQRDSTGRSVATGVYTIGFSVNGVRKSAYTVIVNGAITAVTDSLGHYSIPDPSLAMDFYPAPLYGADGTKFLGNFQISTYVILEFYLDSHRSASVTMTKDQLTRFDCRI